MTNKKTTRELLKLYESMYKLSSKNFNNPSFDNRFTVDDLVVCFEIWIVNLNIEIDRMMNDSTYSEYIEHIKYQKSNLDFLDNFMNELSIHEYKDLLKYQVFIRTQLITISRKLTTVTRLGNDEDPSVESMSVLSKNQKMIYDSMDKMLEIQSKLVDKLYKKIIN